jgi:RNA polymerase sigma-70 factor (ECF subfamily)
VANAIALPAVGTSRVSEAKLVDESLDAAFARLLREHGPALSRLVAAYERHPQDREDLMQEIALAIWRSLPSFRGESSERTFIFRIGHNRAMTHSSRAKTHRARVAGSEALASVPDPHPDSAARMVVTERHDRLMACIHQLAPTLRETVVLSLEGLSYHEIAEVLGTSANAVAVRLTRARAALASQLVEQGGA